MKTNKFDPKIVEGDVSKLEYPDLRDVLLIISNHVYNHLIDEDYGYRVNWLMDADRFGYSVNCSCGEEAWALSYALIHASSDSECVIGLNMFTHAIDLLNTEEPRKGLLESRLRERKKNYVNDLRNKDNNREMIDDDRDNNSIMWLEL